MLNISFNGSQIAERVKDWSGNDYHGDLRSGYGGEEYISAYPDIYYNRTSIRIDTVVSGELNNYCNNTQERVIEHKVQLNLGGDAIYKVFEAIAMHPDFKQFINPEFLPNIEKRYQKRKDLNRE